jgi:hypothetical protein
MPFFNMYYNGGKEKNRRQKAAIMLACNTSGNF